MYSLENICCRHEDGHKHHPTEVTQDLLEEDVDFGSPDVTPDVTLDSFSSPSFGSVGFGVKSGIRAITS